MGWDYLRIDVVVDQSLRRMTMEYPQIPESLFTSIMKGELMLPMGPENSSGNSTWLLHHLHHKPSPNCHLCPVTREQRLSIPGQAEAEKVDARRLGDMDSQCGVDDE